MLRAREAARPPGALERGPQRERAGDRAGARHDPGHRARGRRRRAHHRGARAAARRHGRVPSARHARHPAARRVPLSRRVRHSRVLVLLYVGVHEPDAHRRVPRRGTPRGHVRDRACGRRAGRADGCRPGRAAPPQLHPQGPVPVQQPGRTRLRFGRLRTCARPGARDGRLRRAASRAAHAPRVAGGRSSDASRRRDLHVRRDVRARAEPGARVAAIRRWRLGSGDGAGAARPAPCRSSPDRRRTARRTRRRGR